MLLIQALLLLLTWTTTLVEALVANAPPNGRTQITSTLKSRQNANTPYPVTGVQTGQILPRREIRDLQNNYPDQFNIMILAWQSLQAMDQSDFLSYFQIAGTYPSARMTDLTREGIHGVPAVDWNGVHGQATDNPGYCTHVSNIFLPWHRPYLALFEVGP